MKKLFLIPLCALLAGACVSNKKYLAATSKISSLQYDSLTLANRLTAANGQVTTLQGKVDQMQASNAFTTDQLNQTQDEVNKQRARVVQLQTLMEQQRKNVEALRQKMADAMTGFNSDQLTVSIKNGKVYVSLQESLLFPSGSAEVNPKGKEALGTLATVLNQNQDINVLVEGHTDSLPITKRYEDNWALSLARSASIVRVLQNDYKVAPERVTASGHSSYEPIADNATPDGRAKNRRTEIILEPKLDELMKLLEGGGS